MKCIFIMLTYHIFKVRLRMYESSNHKIRKMKIENHVCLPQTSFWQPLSSITVLTSWNLPQSGFIISGQDRAAPELELVGTQIYCWQHWSGE